MLPAWVVQAKEVPGAAVGNGWASEFDTEQEAAAHEDVWRQFNGVRLTLSTCRPCLEAAPSLLAHAKTFVGPSCGFGS